MIFGTSRVAIVWAASRSLASRMSRDRRILAAWSTAPARGHEGQAARQQVVAAVAVGDLDDVAALAQPVDVGAQDDLHHRRPPSRRRRVVDLGRVDREPGLGVAASASRSRPGRPLARRAGALRRHPLGVRQQRHLAGDLDRPGDLALLLHVVAADATVADLGAVAHEPRQQVDVLVVDVHHLLGDQRAGLLLVLAGGRVLGRPGPVLLAGHQFAFICCAGGRRVLRTALRRRRSGRGRGRRRPARRRRHRRRHRRRRARRRRCGRSSRRGPGPSAGSGRARRR